MEGIPITISLCMIVRDEEDTIPRCLDSVRDVADEIIIVDTGSKDSTKEVAGRYTDKIYDYEWIDDFSAARNYAHSLAGMDYILYMDADDIFTEEDYEKLIKLKADMNPLVDIVNMPYLLGADEYGAVTFSLRRNRLVRRSMNYLWHGFLHEYLEVHGNVLVSDICITHKRMKNHTNRNLQIFEKHIANGKVLTSRELYYYANELYEHTLIDRAVETYRKFIDTDDGYADDKLIACARLADCFLGSGDKNNQLHYLLRSMEYATPRAEICCSLGYYFLEKESYEQSIFWYKMAAHLEKPSNNWGLMVEACWTWLPHLQLCVCYDRIGSHQKAYEHNEIARSYRPDDPNILQNKKYLEGVLGIGCAKGAEAADNPMSIDESGRSDCC